jgi:hypothetical protein
MKNKLSLTLDLTFSEDAKITKKDKQEIIANVMEALRSHINSCGIAPEEKKYVTDVIDIQDKKDKVKLKFNLSEAKYIFD